MMPIDLVLVRHGESEGNLAKHLMKCGRADAIPAAFWGRHSSKFRLTTQGISQAEAAGQWLRDHGLASFDRCYASEYVRAFETAGHLGLPLHERWFTDYMLRERDYGLFDAMPHAEREEKFEAWLREMKRDAFLCAPPNGESIADVAMRLGRLLDTLHRECSDKRVIVVCHGETMWAMRVRLERMNGDRYNALDASRDPHDRINNCQIIHYARRDPETGRMGSRYDWMRSVCPWDPARSSNAWTRIERPSYRNEDLLAMAESSPRLLDNPSDND